MLCATQSSDFNTHIDTAIKKKCEKKVFFVCYVCTTIIYIAVIVRMVGECRVEEMENELWRMFHILQYMQIATYKTSSE